MSTGFWVIYTHDAHGLIHAHMLDGTEVEVEAFATAALRPGEAFEMDRVANVCRVCEYAPCACDQAERE